MTFFYNNSEVSSILLDTLSYGLFWSAGSPTLTRGLTLIPGYTKATGMADGIDELGEGQENKPAGGSKAKDSD